VFEVVLLWQQLASMFLLRNHLQLFLSLQPSLLTCRLVHALESVHITLAKDSSGCLSYICIEHLHISGMLNYLFMNPRAA
jgi:hypothetical protein